MWTGKPITTRNLRDLQQRPCLLQAAPAIEEHEYCNCGEPHVADPKCEPDKANHSHKSQNGGDEQATCSSKNEPQQAAKDLAAVERVDRQHVEDKKTDVDAQDGANEPVFVRHRDRQIRRSRKHVKSEQDWRQRHIH